MRSILPSLFVLITATLGAAESSAPIPLRDLPLLFADDSGVATSSGVKRTVHPARTRPAAVLEGTLPQEGSRVYLTGSVYQDEATGLLSMWYAGHPDLPGGKKPKVEGLRTGKGNFVLYATSTDGIAWDRPNLGQFKFQKSKDNNIIYDFHSPSVLFDPADPDPSRRYKMLGSITGAYYSATSPNGLHWTGPKQPIIKSSDNITLTKDPLTGEYLAFVRMPAKLRGYPRRTVSLSRSRDFITWSKPELVFAPDEQDDVWATAPGQRTEVNNMAVIPHAAGLLGFPTIFRVTITDRNPAELGHGQSPTDGTLDVQLITSSDGKKWQRTDKREPIIARGAAGSFDAGSIFGVSNTAVHVGDETWIYYTGMTTSHGAPIPPKRIAIGRAEWRRHGFVSLDASDETARIETKPLQLSTSNLIVNAAAAGGELRVALLESDGKPIPGFTLDDSTPLTKDAVRASAQWRDQPAPPIDRAVRVLIQLKKARLFSLSCAAATHDKPRS